MLSAILYSCVLHIVHLLTETSLFISLKPIFCITQHIFFHSAGLVTSTQDFIRGSIIEVNVWTFCPNFLHVQVF